MGDRHHLVPGFLKLPTSSRFLVSTLINGMVPTLESCSKFRDVFELLIAIRARVRREHLVVDAERVAHLMKQARDCI
jgi:hypothetical protein